MKQSSHSKWTKTNMEERKLSHSNHPLEKQAFGCSSAALRVQMNLSRRDLARLLAVSEQTVARWERGVQLPTRAHLQQMLTLALQRQAFPAEQARETVEQLWLDAGQLAGFEAFWRQAKQTAASAPPGSLMRNREAGQLSEPRTSLEPALSPSRVDWGEAFQVDAFYGREQELAQLSRWVMEDRCRVISVLGMGGVGKSALAVSLMRQLAPHFESVIFRSLRDAPLCEVLLDDCLQVLSPQRLSTVPADLEQRIILLLQCLQQFRALVVLDNLEALLEEGNIKGRFRPGYEDYGRLLRRVGTATHQSCLLLTSREKPAEVELRRMEGKSGPVRALRLGGLSTTECEFLFAEKGITGTPQDRTHLAEVYAGNPLALKIVAETISRRFSGQIAPFLSEDLVIFGTITNLLDEQFARLSPLEQTVLCWLAIVREPVTLDELRAVLITPALHMQLLEAIESLHRRSLLERGQRSATFTLQAVVLEYVTAVLIKEVTHELQQHQLKSLIQYGLEQASAREYVRQTQERLLLTPIIANLRRAYQKPLEIEQLLLCLLDQLRQRDDHAQGYGPANLIALLRLQCGHLRGLDLSQLSIRGANLQGVEMQDARLCGTILHDTLLTEAMHAIWSVAVSRTGTFWAAGSRQGEVRVWREEGRLFYRVWQAHTDIAYTLAFSPDERTLATASWDGTVKLWDLEQGALLWTGNHLDIIRALAFSPTGHLLATGCDDGTIHLWNPASGVLIQQIRDERGAVYTLAWSPDSYLLASSGIDGSIRLWQIQGTPSATCIQVLSGHTNWTFGLAFAPDGATLASGGWDKTVKLWDVENFRLRHTLTGHTGRVQIIAWSLDGRTIASAGFDNFIWLWDVEHRSCRTVLQGHTAVVYTLAFTPDSRRLLSGSEDGTLGIWDVEKGHCERIIQGFAVALYNVAWNPAGTQLATAGSDQLVIIWDATNQTPPRVYHGHQWTVFGVEWSPDGRFLASSGRDNAIRLWDLSTGTPLKILRDPDHADTIFYGVAWSPDGRFLASSSYRRGVQAWNVEKGQRSWVGSTLPTRIRCVAWSPDGSRLVSGGDDGSICLLRADDGVLLARWQHHRSGVVCVAWSPDGKHFASGGGGRGGEELFVWDADSGKIIRSLTEQPGSVFALTWSKNGKKLVTGSNDGSLRWWDVDTWKLLHIRQGHQNTSHDVQVSPDGRLVASCGDDSTIRLWDLETTELVQTLRRDRPYERLNITGLRGVTEAQKASLRALGAFEEIPVTSS
jgi:WD40 repeat protein/DNA-binding transcriptional regulator YiaG